MRILRIRHHFTRTSMRQTALFSVLIFVGLSLPFAEMQAQRISNVYPDVSGNKIYINYSLLDIADDQSVLITVFMSTDGGENYGTPLKSVSGDVGLVTGPGENKTITWDVFNDLDELVTVNAKFKVKADLMGSQQNAKVSVRKLKINLNTNLGYKNSVAYNSFGTNVKGVVYLDQLGLGIRADYYKTFRKEINYSSMSIVYPDTGFFWGYSAGGVLEYDFIKSERYSLSPFLYIGQSKFIYKYNPEYNDEGYFEYSIFGSLGMSFDMNVFSFLYLGLEMEYMISPWIDLIPSDLPDESLDGISIGFVLKFVIDTN